MHNTVYFQMQIFIFTLNGICLHPMQGRKPVSRWPARRAHSEWAPSRPLISLFDGSFCLNQTRNRWPFQQRTVFPERSPIGSRVNKRLLAGCGATEMFRDASLPWQINGHSEMFLNMGGFLVTSVLCINHSQFITVRGREVKV